MDDKDDKIRVVTFLKQEEKEALQELAWKSGRSMSGYLRFLVIAAADMEYGDSD